MLIESSSFSNALPCPFDHRSTDVEANDLRPMLDEPGRVQSRSAPNVQDPFALDGGKEAQHRRPIIVSVVHAVGRMTLEILSDSVVGGGDRRNVGGTHRNLFLFVCRFLSYVQVELKAVRALYHLFDRSCSMPARMEESDNNEARRAAIPSSRDTCPTYPNSRLALASFTVTSSPISRTAKRVSGGLPRRRKVCQTNSA